MAMRRYTQAHTSIEAFRGCKMEKKTVLVPQTAAKLHTEPKLNKISAHNIYFGSAFNDKIPKNTIQYITLEELTFRYRCDGFECMGDSSLVNLSRFHTFVSSLNRLTGLSAAYILFLVMRRQKVSSAPLMFSLPLAPYIFAALASACLLNSP